MATIVTRAGKGSPLTNTEVDANFVNLNTELGGKQAQLVSGTNIKTVGGATIVGSGDVGVIGVAYGGTGASTLTSGYLVKGNGTSAVTASVMYDDGTNVGIGTTSPATKLQVYGVGRFGTTGTIDINNDGTNGSITNYTGNMLYYTPASAGYIWHIGSVEQVRISSTGSLLVGTLTSSGYRLNVDSGTANEVARFKGAANGYISLTDGTGEFRAQMSSNSPYLASIGAYPMLFATNNTERMRLTAAGDLTLSRKIIPNVQSVTSSATITPNADTDTQVSVTALAVPATIAAPSGTPSDGQSLVIRIEDNATARALTWTTGSSGAYRAVGITLPTTTVAAKVLYVGCKYNSADLRWDAVAVSQEA